MEQLQLGTLVATFSDGNMEFIEFQCNPTEYSLEKGVQNSEINIPGLDSPLLQFIRGQDERLTLELFFDTTEHGMGAGATSVTTLTDSFYSLVKIKPEDHAPPLISFLWNQRIAGSGLSGWTGNQNRPDFTGVIESIRQKFTLFSPEGVPLRATLTLVLREYKTLDDQIRQLNLQSPDRTQSHVVQSGETLGSISARHYRRPGLWRNIADANRIEDPRRLTPGIFLAVPPLD
ncbi:MAG: LysM peptidoglycan-binding domain-containing protein [Anaerolineales bacterium]|nr:LysM peptidoglycan-binding domain-containing protein [Anaerolineales bacterium]